jgi:hypothetical protein
MNRRKPAATVTATERDSRFTLSRNSSEHVGETGGAGREGEGHTHQNKQKHILLSLASNKPADLWFGLGFLVGLQLQH